MNRPNKSPKRKAPLLKVTDRTTKKNRKVGLNKFERSPYFAKLETEIKPFGLGARQVVQLNYSPENKELWGMTAKNAMRHQERCIWEYMLINGWDATHEVVIRSRPPGLPEGSTRIEIRPRDAAARTQAG